MLKQIYQEESELKEKYEKKYIKDLRVIARYNYIIGYTKYKKTRLIEKIIYRQKHELILKMDSDTFNYMLSYLSLEEKLYLRTICKTFRLRIPNKKIEIDFIEKYINTLENDNDKFDKFEYIKKNKNDVNKYFNIYKLEYFKYKKYFMSIVKLYILLNQEYKFNKLIQGELSLILFDFILRNERFLIHNKKNKIFAKTVSDKIDEFFILEFYDKNFTKIFKNKMTLYKNKIKIIMDKINE